LTLFEDSSRKVDIGSRENEKGKRNLKSGRNRELKSKTRTRNSDLQKTWEEMYKSVEKSKRNPELEDDAGLESLEEKLVKIKNLRDQKKISEREYQKRKGRLLKGL